MKKSLLLAAGFAMALSACATPKVVQERQIGDESMSCAQLKTEIADAERFEKQARDERGMTGKNVAAAVLFWPALVATYANTDDAIEAARDRREHLREIYVGKGCS